MTSRAAHCDFPNYGNHGKNYGNPGKNYGNPGKPPLQALINCGFIGGTPL